MGAVNGDGGPVPPGQMGLNSSAWYSTGLGGSESTGGLESPDLATVGVVPVYQSSQGDPVRVTVGVGDTFSSSSDTAIVPSPLLPPGADVTGIGNIRAPGSV